MQTSIKKFTGANCTTTFLVAFADEMSMKTLPLKENLRDNSANFLLFSIYLIQFFPFFQKSM